VLRTRVIPSLLLKNGGLVKTVRFRDPVYVGDPINAVKIFNDKEADELAFLDISATPAGRGPDFRLLESIAAEAFMPFGYGGGIRSVSDVRTLFSLGIEKVILNTAAFDNRDLVSQAAAVAGSSSVVVSIDVGTDIFRRRRVKSDCGRRNVSGDAVSIAVEMAEVTI
jgi:imidazole glycerol-phosphate synthase subunit HisF